MRRAGEVEHFGDIAHVVAGILRQLGGRNQPHEIDHDLIGPVEWSAGEVVKSAAQSIEAGEIEPGD